MLQEKYIRPIPKKMLEKIKKRDIPYSKKYCGTTRYYAYLARYGGELVKVTVAVKNRGRKWFCKQVAVHGIHSERCYVKDMQGFYIAGYITGWFAEGLSSYRKWWETGVWETTDKKYYNVYAPILNPEFALTFPEYKYSAASQYKYVDLLDYLRYYEQYPQAEMLVKFGLSSFATSKQILRKVEKDKQFRKWLINHSTELRERKYYVSTLLLAYKLGESLERTQRFEEEKKKFYRTENYKNIKALFPTDKDVRRFLDYIRVQNTNLSSYSDYLKACTYLGLDMRMDKNKLPHDFKRWHDIRIDEYHTKKAEEDAEKRKELYAKFSVVAEKYLPLQRNMKEAFVVVIARTPQDLIHEGDYLHHCVGRMNYDQRMIREESLIFFIRSREYPNTPFVTVEYSLRSRKVLQCYGEKDTKPSQQVLDFVNKKWLPYANRKLKQIAA